MSTDCLLRNKCVVAHVVMITAEGHFSQQGGARSVELLQESQNPGQLGRGKCVRSGSGTSLQSSSAPSQLTEQEGYRSRRAESEPRR